MSNKQILQRLKQFQSLNEKQNYQEFLFCLLTPQSQAQRCWQAILNLNKLSKQQWTLSNITSILQTKTRFHNVKAIRILNAPQTFKIIKPLLEEKELEIPYIRSVISKTVNGYGLKEASHFLRNIGLSNNKIAILDRHILRNLKLKSLIQDDKITSNKHYLEIESTFINYSKKLKIPADVLDLQWWSKENGEIFK